MPVPELTLTPVDHNPFVDDATAAAFPETVGNPGIDAAVRGIAGGIKDFVTTPGTLANTPNPYPPGSEESIEFERTRQQAGDNWARNAALATMGTGAVAGLPVNAGEAVLGAGPIRAYHGSPHDFDAFSLDKIGTGEGAQAYGHGLYFAESPGVAQSYRDALAPGQAMTLNGTPVTDLPPAYRRVAQWIENTGAHPEDIAKISDQRAAKAIQEGKDLGLEDAAEAYASDHVETAKAARDLAAKGEWKVGRAPNGKMYEVQINADPEHFLDWDKPVSELPDEIKQKLGTLAGSHGHETVGTALGRAYRHEMFAGDLIGKDRATPIELTAGLRDAGIPGIKYLDQGSRASGEGSRNYVVFDDKLIDIIRKYGMAGLSMLPPATAAYLTQRIQPVDHDPFEQGAGVLKPVDHDPFAAQL